MALALKPLLWASAIRDALGSDDRRAPEANWGECLDMAVAASDAGGDFSQPTGTDGRDGGDLSLTKTQSALEIDMVVRELSLIKPFRVAGRTLSATPIVTVGLTRLGVRGRGEAAGVYFLEDTPEKIALVLRELGPALDPYLTRAALRRLLPPGGARNALDCALWELEARTLGQPVWKIAGLDAPRPLVTTMTLGAEEPGLMAAAAISYQTFQALKLKLTGDADIDAARVRAVRAARPDVWLGVDCNQGYTLKTLEPLTPVLVECRVSLLEQPFKRGCEADMDGLRLPFPVGADESCLDLEEIEPLVGRFDAVNIKLDKCGGLTEGLMMARRAQSLGLKVMVGNMVGTSLSIAPAFLLGQVCDLADLDGPLLIRNDPEPTVAYDGGAVWCAPNVWGGEAPACL